MEIFSVVAAVFHTGKRIFDMSSLPLSDLGEEEPLINYGAFDDEKPLPSESETSETTSVVMEDETLANRQMLEGSHAKFSPKCVFESEAWGTGTATIANEILNLVKNIVGSGGLSLPGGIAAFGNRPTAIIPAIGVILFMGILNAYSFSLLGRVCAVSKSKTYQEAWDRTMGRRFGTKYNIWVGLVVTGKAILGCWGFSIVISSTCQPLLRILGVHATKSETLLGITLLVLLPLCFLERLSSLAFFSMIGQLGTLMTAFTMTLRFFDRTYRYGGTFYDVRSCLCTASECHFSAHTHAFSPFWTGSFPRARTFLWKQGCHGFLFSSIACPGEHSFHGICGALQW